MTGAADGVELHWIPLGAGARSVRWNGIVFEALTAMLRRRRRCDLFHSVLVLHLDGERFTVEMTPVPRGDGAGRGVVAVGAVGSRRLRRARLFRYEVRRWRDGVVPDLAFAVGGPVRITTDPVVTRRVFDALPHVPTATWGRDDLDAGEMWTCNSVIAWALARAGVDPGAIPMPPHARAPGWAAGGLVAARDTKVLRPWDAPATDDMLTTCVTTAAAATTHRSSS